MLTQEALGATSRPQATSFLIPVAKPVTPCSILLAEDSDDLREVMSIFLEISGYQVIACSDAQQASAEFHLKLAAVDVLLTDIEMPGRSGIELARELTSLRPSLPVLIVSGSWITPEMYQEFQSRGWKHLSKPVGLPAVLTSLKLLLGSVVSRLDGLPVTSSSFARNDTSDVDPPLPQHTGQVK